MYNTDFSFYKHIDIPPQPNPYSIGYLKERLFDTDTTYLEYLLFGSYPTTYVPYVRVYDENGNNLFSADSLNAYSFSGYGANGQNQSAVINSDSTAILILFKLASGGSSLRNYFRVYSLPGKLEDSCCCNNFANNILRPDSPHRFSFNAFPNPSKGKIILNYELPEGIKKAELTIYSTNGNEMKRYKVTNAFKFVELDNSELPSGTYFYQLLLPDGNFGTKKMILVK